MTRSSRRLAIGALLLLPALLSAQSPFSNRRADLSRLVVVGDSLSAGFQNYSLLGTQQVNSYVNLLATQAKTPLVLPLIAYPGVPNVLKLVSVGPPPVIEPAKDAKLPDMPRTNPREQPTNLAVPGFTVSDCLNKRPSPVIVSAIDAMTNLVLGIPSPLVTLQGTPRSQPEWAIALKPTTMIVWIGANDALLAELTGDFSLLTSPFAFAHTYHQLLDKLEQANAGATVVANLPDVTVVPFLTSLSELSKQTGVPAAVLGARLGMGVGDFVRPGAQPEIAKILGGVQPGPLPQLCDAGIPGLPISKVPCVLRASEAQTIRNYVLFYNAIIGVEALVRRNPMVDIYSLVQQMDRNGYQVGTHRLTLDFLGGFVGLDGIHPTSTGHAIFANEFIRVMNRQLNTNIPLVDLVKVANSDPLVFH